MTKRHFEQFAASIKMYLESSIIDSRHAASYMAHMVADIAEQDNPRFDRARFMRACGLES